MIPQLCEIILLDLQTRSIHDSFAKPIIMRYTVNYLFNGKVGE